MRCKEIWLSLVILGLATGPLGAVERLTLNSVRQLGDRPPTVRVYLDAVDEQGQALQALAPENLTATLGQDSATIGKLESFRSSGEGVATIFLVDISKSLTADQFAAIREALGSWVDDFGPGDVGAVLAFGATSRLVQDFTADGESLKAGLASLGPTDNRTLLHQALADALALSRRRDEGLPGRRVIVVLTDGLDEGSGLALDDVLERLRQDPVPIHAIGYSRLQPEERQQRYLEVLKRLATNSGGSFFEARKSDFAQSYAAIREAIRRVWVADVVCESCRADGSLQRLQLTVEAEGRIFSQGTDLRLLPDPSRPPRSRLVDRLREQKKALEEAAGKNGAGAPAPAPKPGWWQAVPWWIYALLAVLVVVLMSLIFSQRRDEGEAEELEDGQEPEEPVGPSILTMAPTEPEIAPPPRSRSIRLMVVRGSRKGKEYWLTLRDRAVVGSRSSCDCVLAAEPGVGLEQFEFYQEEDKIFIRNLATTNPTRMGGHTLDEPRRVRSNDLVGTAETILRILIDT